LSRKNFKNSAEVLQSKTVLRSKKTVLLWCGQKRCCSFAVLQCCSQRNGAEVEQMIGQKNMITAVMSGDSVIANLH
jgi:hypothetical protein